MNRKMYDLLITVREKYSGVKSMSKKRVLHFERDLDNEEDESVFLRICYSTGRSREEIVFWRRSLPFLDHFATLTRLETEYGKRGEKCMTGHFEAISGGCL